MTWEMRFENWARKVKETYLRDTREECLSILSNISNETGDRFFHISECVYEAYFWDGRVHRRYAYAMIFERQNQP